MQTPRKYARRGNAAVPRIADMRSYVIGVEQF